MKPGYSVLFAFFLLTLLISCSQPCCTNIDINVTVSVKDQAGNNLLDPATTGFYKPEEIKLFSLNNGVRTQLVNTNTNKYHVYQEGAKSFLTFYPEGSGSIITTIVQWRTNDEDVFESTLESTKNSTICTAVKCNGVVKFDLKAGVVNPDGFRRQIDIVK